MERSQSGQRKRSGLFLSGRFDSIFPDLVIREVAKEIREKAPFLEVLIVDAAKARDEDAFQAETMDHLANMECIVPFVFIDYGQFTGTPCGTFQEVRYCLERPELPRFPLKLYSSKLWPPIPNDRDDPKRGQKSAAQNMLFFKKDQGYKEFVVKTQDDLEVRKLAIADYIISCYLRLRPDLDPGGMADALGGGEVARTETEGLPTPVADGSMHLRPDAPMAGEEPGAEGSGPADTTDAEEAPTQRHHDPAAAPQEGEEGLTQRHTAPHDEGQPQRHQSILHPSPKPTEGQCPGKPPRKKSGKVVTYADSRRDCCCGDFWVSRRQSQWLIRDIFGDLPGVLFEPAAPTMAK